MSYYINFTFEYIDLTQLQYFWNTETLSSWNRDFFITCIMLYQQINLVQNGPKVTIHAKEIYLV